MFRKYSRGFTLVELLVIIGLVGVIFAGTITLINPAHQLQKGRDAQRKGDLKTIQQAAELFRADNSRYPMFGSEASPVGGWAPASSMVLNIGGVTYLRTIPTGPSGNSCDYVYMVPGSGNVYSLYTNLENTQDRDATAVKPAPAVCSGCSNNGNVTITINSGSCSGRTYNYWANSP